MKRIFLIILVCLSQLCHSETIVLEEYDHIFSIDFPPNWEVIEGWDLDENKRVLVRAENAGISEITIGLADVYLSKYSDEGFTRNDADTAFYSIDTYLEEQAKALKKRYPDQKIIEQNIKYIDKKKVFYTKISARFNDVDFIESMYQLSYKGCIYTIAASSLIDTYPEEEEVMNRSIESIKFYSISEETKVTPKTGFLKSILSRLVDAATRGISYVILGIVISIIVGIITIPSIIVNKIHKPKQAGWIKRREKVWKITDKNALMEIVKNDPNKNVREAAESRLQDLSDD